MKILRKSWNTGDWMAVWDKHALNLNSTTKACLHPSQIVVHKEQFFAPRRKKSRSLLLQNIPHLGKKPF